MAKVDDPSGANSDKSQVWFAPFAEISNPLIDV